MKIAWKKEYIFGDMRAVYAAGAEDGQVGLALFPIDFTETDAWFERVAADSLIQLKLVGDDYAGAYSGRVLRRIPAGDDRV